MEARGTPTLSFLMDEGDQVWLGSVSPPLNDWEGERITVIRLLGETPPLKGCPSRWSYHLRPPTRLKTEKANASGGEHYPNSVPPKRAELGVHPRRLGSVLDGCVPQSQPTQLDPCNTTGPPKLPASRANSKRAGPIYRRRLAYGILEVAGGWVMFCLGPEAGVIQFPAPIRGLSQQKGGGHLTPRTNTIKPTSEAHPSPNNP